MTRAKRKRMTPGKLIHVLRDEMNISQRELGEKLGLHQTAVSRIELGMQDLAVNEFRAAFRLAMTGPGEAFAEFERFLYGDWV